MFRAGGRIAYTVPMPCPCSHVIGDLPPRVAVQIIAAGMTASATTDGNGVLTFSTDDAATSEVQLVQP